jgi:hypothetical protein
MLKEEKDIYSVFMLIILARKLFWRRKKVGDLLNLLTSGLYKL